LKSSYLLNGFLPFELDQSNQPLLIELVDLLHQCKAARAAAQANTGNVYPERGVLGAFQQIDRE